MTNTPPDHESLRTTEPGDQQSDHHPERDEDHPPAPLDPPPTPFAPPAVAPQAPFAPPAVAPQAPFAPPAVAPQVPFTPPPFRAFAPPSPSVTPPPLAPPPSPVATSTEPHAAPVAPPPSDPPVPTQTKPRAPRWVTPLVLLAGLALFAGGLLAGWALFDGDDVASDATDTTDVDTAPTPISDPDGGEAGLVPTNAEEPVAAVAQAVAPSVVQINTDFGLGSGIVMDDDGHILTAAHVIEGATQLRVRLPDGTMVSGTVVGTHPESDVGVVKVDPRPDLIPAVLGIDADVQVGQLAVAVGSPFGLEQTVTSGIVSALDRPVETEGSLLVGMIQTDASINPGNSGGALADRHGRVIGINDAIRTQGGGNEGVGFAIPIDLAFSVADRLIAGEPIQSGFLGVSANNPVEGRPGALVQEVTPGTPADDAGIIVGDLIVSLDGQPVRGIRELRAGILAIEPGTPVVLEVVRGDDTIELEVVLTTNTQ